MGFTPEAMRKPDPLTEEQITEIKKKGFDRWLPYPVSVNQLHMPSQGRLVLTTKARAYYASMCELLRDNQCPTLTGSLVVHVWLYDPDLRRRDINNYTKTLFDALEMAKVYEDDKQICETHIYRGDELREGGIAHVVIKELAPKTERIPIKEMKKRAGAIEREKDRAKVIKRAFGKEATEGLKLFQIKKPGDTA